VILTITSTAAQARDLGYLLHKHPDRVHEVELTFGRSTCAFPEASDDRCTAALVVEVDPIALVRGRKGSSGGEGLLDQYVNDRPYAASSLLSVALSATFRSAMAGRCPQRPELVDRALKLETRIAALPCRGGEALLRRLFEPLGHAVEAERLPLDPAHPEWGESAFHRVTLRSSCPLRELLAHLYVLMPVLDDDKHYYVGAEETEKLLRHGEAWLHSHPERELIVRRYLRHDRRLTRETLARLTVEDAVPDPDAAVENAARAEDGLERGMGLDQARRDFVLAVLAEHGAASVIDLGCGEGKLLKELVGVKRLRRIAGLDVSLRSLQRAEHRLGLGDMSDRNRERIQLLHGSLVYRDARLSGFDAAVAVEVIEHLDPFRLAAFERVVLREAAAPLVVVTTPNAEYNALFPTLPAGKMRHPDHRFEWTRAEFAAWSQAAAAAHGYACEIRPVGPVHEELGAPTQAAVFTRE
jgi:3' terminal RNA ribose 2'-O-methyltransferase Hen1